MPFIEHKRCRNQNSIDNIKASFMRRGDTLLLTLIFGLEVCEKFNLVAGERFKLFYDTENPRKLLIKKSEDNKGYKLILPPAKNCLRSQFSWKAKGFILLEEDMFSHAVEYEITKDGIEINL